MEVSDASHKAFENQGYLRLRSVFTRTEIEGLKSELTTITADCRFVPTEVDSAMSSDYFLARKSQAVAGFVMNPRLGNIAAKLLNVPRVRLINDVLIGKERNQRATPWHRDSDFWSFEGAGALTFWIPLQDTPLDMAPLRFAVGSHLVPNPRVWYPVVKTFVPLRFPIASPALSIGDITVHHFKTLHGAGRNSHPSARRALVIHLIDADARFLVSRRRGHRAHARRVRWDTLHHGEALPEDLAPLLTL